jgi:Homeodomain-like domain-containing protein
MQAHEAKLPASRLIVKLSMSDWGDRKARAMIESIKKFLIPEYSKHPGGRPPREFNHVEAAMLRLEGWSYRQIAAHFGISKSLAQRELRGWVPTNSPTPVVQPEVEPTPGPVNSDTRPIDWDEERRTDLPLRTPERIQFLLQFETSAQTHARILNDQGRYRSQRR